MHALGKGHAHAKPHGPQQRRLGGRASAPCCPHPGTPREQQASHHRRVWCVGRLPEPLAGAQTESHAVKISLTVTSVLLALNIAIFGLMVLAGVHPMQPAVDDLIRWGANYGPQTTQGQWWRLGSCVFLHIGLLHLLFNMVALWNVGALMERLLGRVGFLTLYVLSGLFSSLLSLAWHPAVVSAGASGAIFGVYGGLLAFLVRHRDMQHHGFLTALRSNTLAFLGYNLVFGMLQQGIDMAAHVGGLLAGFGCGLLLTSTRPLRSRARQQSRSGLIGVLGLLLLWYLTGFLPRAEDIEGRLQQFATLENATLTEFQRLMLALQQGQTTEAEVRRVLEQDLLPPWREQGQVFQRLSTSAQLSNRQRQLARTLMQYIRTRQEGWELLHDGLRTQNARLLQQAQDKQRQADRLLGGTGRGGGR